eukprot:TRINITY_DN2544_c0_g5_i1.p1 TRINITY_DN2544_c0_g5~~TRINITY_DN2544_c0_g5_i1.p1  ORF type:complete len:648 (+),score=129.56 TRINITY_DN2544_c0_g5_i1:70-2013(+)
MPTYFQKAWKAFLRVVIDPVLCPDDTELHRERKRAIAIAVSLTTPVGAVALVITNTREARLMQTSQNYVMILTNFVLMLFYVWLRWRKQLSVPFLYCLFLILSLTVCVMDLHRASSYQVRAWPFFVVILDLMLVCNLPDGSTRLTGLCMALWLVVTSVESGYRFGLYDLPGLAPEDQRRRTTECASPPCPVASWKEGMMMTVLVFLLDFSITRGFAIEVGAKRAALEESVDVARLLAQHLAAYDLDAADRCLQAGKLPADMAAVFNDLLANLKTYRPFLPDSLFPGDDEGKVSDEEEDAPPSSRASDRKESEGSSCASDLAEEQHASRVGRRVSLSVQRPVSLEPKEVTLLCVHPHHDPSSKSDTPPVYDAGFVGGHTALLSAVFDAVKAHRGSLDYFHGERIYASFNAFGRAANHAVYAVSASSRVMDANVVTAAVVTGTAHAGYLGTAAVRSPSIVGNLPVMLEQVLRCAVLVKEGVVCCRATAREARMQHPLRQLVHRCLLGFEASGTVLYALCEDLLNQSISNNGPQEWMYELGQNASAEWASYNAAAEAYSSGGLQAALEHMASAGTDQQTRTRLELHARAAMTIDLRARCYALSDGPMVPEGGLMGEPSSATPSQDARASSAWARTEQSAFDNDCVTNLRA